MPSHAFARRLLIAVALLALAGISIACARPNSDRALVVLSVDPARTAQPTPSSAGAKDSATPSPSQLHPEGNSTKLATSYRAALSIALEWQETASFYGLVPATAMSQLFALPYDAGETSLFFRFAVEGQQQELVVEIVGGKPRGSNVLVLPSYLVPSVDSLQPLGDVSGYIDGETARQTVQNAKESGCLPAPVIGLWHPRELTNPTWIVYCSSGSEVPFVAVDAVTSELVSLP